MRLNLRDNLGSQLKKRLEKVSALRKSRQQMAFEVIERPEWFKPLLEIGLVENNRNGSRACWVLEFVCKKQLWELYPHLDRFTSGLIGVNPQSSIRPLAKICELLTEAYYKAPASAYTPPLTALHKERIAEACFRWLLGPCKVAPKAYSMQCLFLLGTEIHWIHDEMAAITTRYYNQESPAYQARTRQVMGRIKKFRKSGSLKGI
ncbi:adenylosuccinate lyase [Robiginitalea sp. IMCC43444]|uniref:adenylosuccinate lyase n=1 Tax=Robiginitalea sp. IMCC43444 TaxID=3459121 RepID=UPI0040418DBD